MKKEFSFDFLGRKIIVEVGELAKQANGAVLVRYGDTVVLSASVMSDNVGTGDFFPLTVVYNEKLYSVGKFQVDLSKGKEDLVNLRHLRLD